MNEERLRMVLKQQAENVTVSPALKHRIDARRGKTSNYRVRVLAVAGVAVAVVIALIAYFTGGTEQKQGLVGTPGHETYFAGYWPAHDLAGAQAIQERLDKREGPTWGLSPVETANEYAGQLGWTQRGGTREYPQTAALRGGPVSGSSAEGWTATVDVIPQVPPDGHRGPAHVIHLVGLPGTDDPAWFVSGVVDSNITVSDPASGATIGRFAPLKGNALVFEGQVNVTAFDDAGIALGHTTVMAGGSERTPFDGGIDLTKPSTPSGIIRFEGTNGIGGPSTDVTIVRVRFNLSSWSSATATPELPPPPASTPEPVPAVGTADDTFHCFFEAKHNREFIRGELCMTERYSMTFKDPVEFIGPSSPSLQRATILSTTRTGTKEVYAVRTFYGSSSGLVSTAEGQLTVLRDAGQWLVDNFTEENQHPIQKTMRVQLTFTRPEADQIDCGETGPADSAFVTVTRTCWTSRARTSRNSI